MVIKTPDVGPMGVVVCFGTLIAMLFIITMIPIGYWMIFRIETETASEKREERSVMMLDKQNASLMG